MGSFSSKDTAKASDVKYDQEPFSTFKIRVRQLCTDTLFPDVPPNKIRIRNHPGGGFNRIIRISVPSASASNPPRRSKYILRIPRFDDDSAGTTPSSSGVGHEVATLNFLADKTTIPAPEVVRYDTTADNAIGSAYALHKRISGVDLLAAYPKLSHRAKCRVASELGAIHQELLDVRGCTHGKFVLPPAGLAADPSAHYVQPLGTDDPSLIKPFDTDDKRPSSLELVTSLLAAQRDNAAAESDGLTVKIMDALIGMAEQMELPGYLSGSDKKFFPLAHMDLHPRNILINPRVDLDRDSTDKIITGILDWDGAVLAPDFTGCRQHVWLWDWDADDDEDEDEKISDPPEEDDELEIKCKFDSSLRSWSLGQRLFSDAQYRMARRLFYFATEGLRCNEDIDAAEALVDEWTGFREIVMSCALIWPEFLERTPSFWEGW